MFAKRKNKFFQDIDYLLAEDINDNQITYDKLVRINPYIEKDKALTYSIILNKRHDLDEETKTTLKRLVDANSKKDKESIQRYLDVMEDVGIKI
jgi:hypothetical protein